MQKQILCPLLLNEYIIGILAFLLWTNLLMNTNMLKYFLVRSFFKVQIWILTVTKHYVILDDEASYGCN